MIENKIKSMLRISACTHLHGIRLSSWQAYNNEKLN